MAVHAPGREVRAAGTALGERRPGAARPAPTGPAPTGPAPTGLILRGLVALLLAGITLLLYLGIGRFVIAGPELLPPLAVPDGGAGWTASGSVRPAGAEGLALSNTDPDGQAALSFFGVTPPGVQYLSLSADLRMEDVAGGANLWESGRLILLTRDGPAANWQYDLPHTVIRGTGSMGWRHVERSFLVQPGSDIRVSVQLLRATGRLWVRDLSLRAAAEPGWFPFAAALLVLSWLAAAAWILWPLAGPLAGAIRSRRPTWQHLRLAALLATVLAIAAGVLVPPQGKQMFRDAAGAVWSLGRSIVAPADRIAPAGAPPAHCGPLASGSPLPALSPLDPRTVQDPSTRLAAAARPVANGDDQDLVSPQQLRWLVADKLGHMAGFALLAILALWTTPRPPGWRRAVLLVVALPGFAALTETWQVMVTTRGASLVDIGIDIAGLALGALAWVLLFAAHRLRSGWRPGRHLRRG